MVDQMIEWANCITINSDTEISDIERHFRVFAGPGAGKTHWLIKHVKNVVKRSKRLGLTRKIACITYTNSGVDEIQGRLKQSAERVEVATIHSFLYMNVVKPYGLLLKNEDRDADLIGLNKMPFSKKFLNLNKF